MTDDVFECHDPNGVPFSKTNNFVDRAWAMKKIKALEEEIARLREALKPFAGMAQHCEGMSDSESQCVFVGDLRAARFAIRKGGEND